MIRSVLTKELYRNDAWVLQEYVDPEQGGDWIEENASGYWVEAKDVGAYVGHDRSWIAHVGEKTTTDIDAFEDIVRKTIAMLAIPCKVDVDREFKAVRIRKALEASRPQLPPGLYKPSEIPQLPYPESLDDGKDTTIVISCHRETNRLRRVLRVYERALNTSHNLGEHRQFKEGLKKLHDHKGLLTATWRSLSAFQRLRTHVEAAWEAENEWEVVHEDEAGREIGRKAV